MSGKGKVQKVREGQIPAGECDKKRNWLREKKGKNLRVKEIKSKNRKKKAKLISESERRKSASQK